jgi:hypothetical protein
VFGAGCSSGGGGGSSGGSKACPLVQKLDDIVADLPTTSVGDPVGFKKSLDTAVDQYAEIVRQLKATVPASLHADLDLVEASVKQYRFPDAVTHRASLDAYAQRECERPLTSSLVPRSSVPGTSGSETSVPGTTPITAAT